MKFNTYDLWVVSLSFFLLGRGFYTAGTVTFLIGATLSGLVEIKQKQQGHQNGS